MKLPPIKPVNELDIKVDFQLKVLENTEVGIYFLGPENRIIENTLKFLIEWETGYEKVQFLFEDLECNVSFKRIRKLDEVLWELVETQQFKDARGNRDAMVHECAKMILFCNAKTIDGFFDTAQTCHWDLPTALHTIADSVFEDLSIKFKDENIPPVGSPGQKLVFFGNRQ